MLPNAFIGRKKKPTEAELTTQLGPARPLWDQLVSDLAREDKVDTQEWHSYSPKAGWSLRLKRAQRTILYMSPSRGGFTASFALGDKAVEAARHSDLPPQTIQLIDGARKYAEGTGVRIEVRGAGDLATVRTLARIKVAN